MLAPDFGRLRRLGREAWDLYDDEAIIRLDYGWVFSQRGTARLSWGGCSPGPSTWSSSLGVWSVWKKAISSCTHLQHWLWRYPGESFSFVAPVLLQSLCLAAWWQTGPDSAVEIIVKIVFRSNMDKQSFISNPNLEECMKTHRGSRHIGPLLHRLGPKYGSGALQCSTCV